MSNTTDAELVERVQRGDKRAFDLLVSKYQNKIFVIISRFINDQAEVYDVAQDTFIKAYRALTKFRGDSQVYTWIPLRENQSYPPGYTELPLIQPKTILPHEEEGHLLLTLIHKMLKVTELVWR